MGISAAFARVLAAGRRQFNARVEEARRRAPGFDSAAFSAFLVDGVDGVVAAVDEAAPARTMAVALVAYDIAVDLCLHALAGPAARTPLLNQTWSRLLPRLATRIAEKPQEVLGSLSNAAVHFAGVDGARGQEWLDHMVGLGPEAASVAQLLDLGKVLAWRCGMAHFRAGALAAADALSPPLQLAALGASADGAWPGLRAALAADPWASPQARRLDGWQVGGFSGFGGRFTQPPELRLAPDGFLLRSGSRHFLAMADAFGAVVLPATADDYAAGELPSAPEFPRRRSGQLKFVDREIALDLPWQNLTLAADQHTVVIASPYTHAIRLLPLR
jgi:hypothetical protein